MVDPDAVARSTSLVDLMSGVLASAVTALENAGVSVPAKRHYCIGEPVIDCEQLYVSFAQAYVGPPGDEASQPRHCDSPLSASLLVGLFRCVPMADARGAAPRAAAVQSAMDQSLIDAYVLLDAACSFDQWDAPLGRGLGVISTVDIRDNSGGYQGVVLNLTVAIP